MSQTPAISPKRAEEIVARAKASSVRRQGNESHWKLEMLADVALNLFVNEPRLVPAKLSTAGTAPIPKKRSPSPAELTESSSPAQKKPRGGRARVTGAKKSATEGPRHAGDGLPGSRPDAPTDVRPAPAPAAADAPASAPVPATVQAHQKAHEIMGEGSTTHRDSKCAKCKRANKECVVNPKTTDGNTCALCAKNKEKCSHKQKVEGRYIRKHGKPSKDGPCQHCVDKAAAGKPAECYQADLTDPAQKMFGTGCSQCWIDLSKESCSANQKPRMKGGKPRDH